MYIEELKAEAKELGIKGFALMKEETLRKAIDEKKSPAEPEEAPAPAEVAEAPKSVNTGMVTFYWRDGKNITFSVKQGEGSELVNTPSGVVSVAHDGMFYKTKDSVIKLEKKVDAKAIAYLRAHKGNEANGGREFGEFDNSKVESSDKGATLEKLMSLDVKTLANMAGGGIAATRKPKGQLISEIMELK